MITMRAIFVCSSGMAIQQQRHVGLWPVETMVTGCALSRSKFLPSAQRQCRFAGRRWLGQRRAVKTNRFRRERYQR